MDASLFYTKSIACVTGKVKDVSKVAGEYHYYTLSMHMKDKMVSCPVMNAEGQVFGIAQKSSGIDTVTTCYAAGAAFAMSQKISALSLGDAALKSIGIRKGLPETEDQALVYLFMASSSLSGEDYEKLLDDFIRQFLPMQMVISVVPIIMHLKVKTIRPGMIKPLPTLIRL